MIKRILEKISWLTRRWRVFFSLLHVSLHDSDESWGFRFFTIGFGLRNYSLLALEWRLPNKTSVQRVVIDDWDFLFLANPLYKRYDTLNDRKLWNRNLSAWEEIQLVILKRLY